MSLVVIGFTVFFIIIWISVIESLKHISGWYELHKKYGNASEYNGKVILQQSLKIRNVDFSNCLLIGITNTHLYIHIYFVFGLLRNSILVPLSDLSDKSDKMVKNGKIVIVHGFEHIPLIFPIRLIKSIESEFGKNIFY